MKSLLTGKELPKRDWCSQCRSWHYEGDLCDVDKITALEADLAELKAAVEWMTKNFWHVENDTGERGGYVVPDGLGVFPAADTPHEALLSAYRAHKAAEKGDADK